VKDAPLGARLRRLREAAGLTQEELASRAGLTAKAISMLERGERKRPYPRTVRSLVDALRLSEGERAVLAGTVPGRIGGSPIPSRSRPRIRLPFRRTSPPCWGGSVRCRR
jgi:transcriptional regulator with XRE-family HTH domain